MAAERLDDKTAARLSREIEGEVLTDPFDRGRYATDASIYQIMPLCVVIPQTDQDCIRAIQIASEAGLAVLPRGAGTSQCGQTVGRALVLDTTRHMNRLLSLDVESRRAVVQPGLVLDRLNAQIAKHGLMFPVDVSTSAQATLGGMAGNNSCGARSIRFGTMRDNVAAIDAVLADGSFLPLGALPADFSTAHLPQPGRALVDRLLALGREEAEEIDRRFPKLQRRVGGYNIDALVPPDLSGRNDRPINLAHLLVGSEGTLAFSRRLTLDLAPIPPHKVLGVCHFPSFYQAMASTKAIVDRLDPDAVELVDRTMIDLARDIPIFRRTVERFVKDQPEALLLVEFAGTDQSKLKRRLRRLTELMGDLGFADAVIEVTDAPLQKAIWEVRKAGLNIMMSMKGDGKPISFIEDCAVRLEDLAEYTDRLTQVFRKHGTTGTWYAHASVGCLHVRPVINLKQELGARQMRAIAEEAFAMVREYKGSHSGEHGDGLVRSEFHRAMFGDRMVAAFERVKDTLDPRGLFNPGKIVRPPRMDDRSLFRFKPGYQLPRLETGFDWSEWGGFGAAVEMCNNNGHCRKFDAGTMCPSYRVTGEEIHLTRGRANTLRLALSGQLGPDALTSDAMAETMALCVGCKGCKRECPTGVDMARMKMEIAHQRAKKQGVGLRERLIAHLPAYAPAAAAAAGLVNAVPRWLVQALSGIDRRRSLPRWRRDPFAGMGVAGPEGAPEAVLFVDCFSRWFEREVADAALSVLLRAGYRVHLPRLCCGRTYLAAGLVDGAKRRARAMLKTLGPWIERGLPVIGVEPSCVMTLRDEYPALLPGGETRALAESAVMFEEFMARSERRAAFKPVRWKKALLHGHCHQKSAAAMDAVEATLRLVPGLEVETLASSCCGMAGAFGYQIETYDMSIAMGELSLLPAVRAADADTVIVADGTSCRHQILDGTDRRAFHVAEILREALT
ncbi:MAG: FAD-binding protein [Alphaproteobacteria bacterium]|nr:FAD-binding protein [Alphaproteobacteria bacterium]